MTLQPQNNPKEEFNLSEKIQPGGNYDYSCKLFWKEDVKEFIRLLKERIKKSIISQQETAYSIIDKLAGEKLIWKKQNS